MRDTKIECSLVIFSVDQAGLSEDYNAKSRALALVALKNAGIKVKVVDGCYKGSPEISFVVENTLGNFATVKKIATEYNQESILLRDIQGHATLFDLKTHSPIDLGYLSAVDKDTALKQDAWTYDNDTGTYYTIVK